MSRGIKIRNRSCSSANTITVSLQGDGFLCTFTAFCAKQPLKIIPVRPFWHYCGDARILNCGHRGSAILNFWSPPSPKPKSCQLVIDCWTWLDPVSTSASLWRLGCPSRNDHIANPRGLQILSMCMPHVFENFARGVFPWTLKYYPTAWKQHLQKLVSVKPLTKNLINTNYKITIKQCKERKVYFYSWSSFQFLWNLPVKMQQ